MLGEQINTVAVTMTVREAARFHNFLDFAVRRSLDWQVDGMHLHTSEGEETCGLAEARVLASLLEPGAGLVTEDEAAEAYGG